MSKKKKDPLSTMIDEVIFDAATDAAKERAVVDIITFCEGREYLDLLSQDPPFELWPMQRIVLKLFYRGTRGNESLEVTDEEIGLLEDIAREEDLDYMEEYGGFWQVVEKYRRRHLHNILLLVMGRRSSKTAIVSIIAAYEAYKLLETPEGNPHKFYRMPQDKPIAILNVAVSEPQAYDPLFKEIESRLARSPYFDDKINHSAGAKNTIYLLTDSDKRENADRMRRGMKILLDGSVVLKSGHSNSASLRGQAAICVLFDEFAHFMTSSGKQSGDEVYNALAPSTRQFGLDGKLVLLSDPRGKEGIFWRLFCMGQEREEIEGQVNHLNDEILPLQLPTWRMNPGDDFTEEELERTEKKKDPLAYWTTWNARFQGEAGERLFNEARLMECVDWQATEAKFGNPRYNYFIHLDPATTSHNYALAMVHVVTMQSDKAEMKRKVVVDCVKFWAPTKDGPVSIEEVERTIRDLCRRFRVALVTFDAFQSASTIERLRMSGIRSEETPFTITYMTKVYTELRNAAHEGDLVLYPHLQLIGELKHVRYKLVTRGFKRMFDPKSEYPTDDCADALAGAAYQALNAKTKGGLPRSGVVHMGFR
jgi:hypothetical protein